MPVGMSNWQLIWILVGWMYFWMSWTMNTIRARHEGIMTHRTFGRFWDFYDGLPSDVQELADKSFEQLKVNTYHPSLHFKKITRGGRPLWSARVEGSLGREREAGVIAWFWIGSHAEYDRLIS